MSDLQAEFNAELENLFTSLAIGRWDDELGHELRDLYGEALRTVRQYAEAINYAISVTDEWVGVDSLHYLNRNLRKTVAKAEQAQP